MYNINHKQYKLKVEGRIIMKKNKGFTIIEVMLVLAIAGLIFLAVFIALPALQRGQRDTQRRSDASTFMSQVQSYSTNNNGKVPTATGVGAFRSNYLVKSDAEFKDPKTGNDYNIVGVTTATAANSPSLGTINYLPGGVCNGETVTSTTNLRQAAIVMALEGAGNFCKDLGT